ncbi:response regulator [Leptospira sp. 2 VSF19]|uniref:Response regulator n=1 Tax=Leptospira soteropolitanensis TaxID=2950025 RepID=A0AAW5VIJ5_9LEPT|nr:response regulator [Leptospira soteropolitanensis]MCW7493965.1 response regulator [Leptospira soteropolitanensis]MCW7501559.1 response regulator [Leptospira soteropolitanensis]MCW7523679.1 response regulator [Leptospira soteropolitanensis]MCW7527542.1 response regulator [Leptospira soteropolitanensis]MCW7531396.1 response regulator [Leptospira soteropolitanensis]
MATILVVDDSAAVLKIVRLALSSQGHKVITCDTGEKALEILKSDASIQLGIFDFNMPGISGIELILETKKIRNQKAFKFLVLSVENKPEIISRALVNGADAWMMKPFNNEQLIKQVTELIEKDASL